MQPSANGPDSRGVSELWFKRTTSAPWVTQRGRRSAAKLTVVLGLYSFELCYRSNIPARAQEKTKTRRRKNRCTGALPMSPAFSPAALLAHQLHVP